MKEDSKSYSHESPEDKKYLNQIWFYSATRGIEEFIQLFLEEFQDFDPNITNRNGNTAFIIASQNNRLKIVDILIKNISVNKNKKNRDGYNALYIAYISGHKHLVTLLKENGLKINLFSYIKASFQTWYKIHKTT
jgi:ankyrin repeat protein